ncbi:MAG TPA: electron transfer flavoprotein subunit alpha/FixB family protein [Clostridiaceae bacterium]|nr:electron transfer flavoprotein subunit alpha/FixB family protein [Clostridiaceae bacterium]
MKTDVAYVLSVDKDVILEICSGLKDKTDKLNVVYLGSEEELSQLKCGANNLYFGELGEYIAEDYVTAIAQKIKGDDSALVFGGNNVKDRAVLAALSALLKSNLLTNVSSIEKDGEELVFSRVVYGGLAEQKTKFVSNYGLVTTSPGLFELIDLGDNDNIEKLEVAEKSAIKFIEKAEKQEKTVNLVAAERIVDVGRGLSAEEDLGLINELAAKIDAAVACSRPVAENDKWLPVSNYLGITGTTVKPELIITVGVSGQVQHMGGINKSKTIVAINKDANAPIFEHCDFGIVGDLYKIVPKLIEKL